MNLDRIVTFVVLALLALLIGYAFRSSAKSHSRIGIDGKGEA